MNYWIRKRDRLMSHWVRLGILAIAVGVIFGSATPIRWAHVLSQPAAIPMLSDPFLQLPTQTTVRVVWFTAERGEEHWVNYGHNLEHRAEAVTRKLSRTREDQHSHLSADVTVVDQANDTDRHWQRRPVWRHEALVKDLTPGRRIPYQVTSVSQALPPVAGETLPTLPTLRTQRSRIFTLAPQPPAGSSSKILLTSDHQLMPMTAANLQQVVATMNQVDAVFFAGDLVNVPDRASEWFDDQRGGAFFPCLQGRAQYKLEKYQQQTIYKGGEIIQHAPLFPAIGNHEVMGRNSLRKDLNEQFNNAVPRAQAEKAYEAIAATKGPMRPKQKTFWLKNRSFNTDTYEEIFSLPKDSPGGKRYYAVSFGDIRLVVLYITNIWRSPQVDPEIRGRYQERTADVNHPKRWGYGQHIFEPIVQGSPQYNWLVEELQSQSFRQAHYKIVMFHHPPHTLGGNIVPPYTDPQWRLITDEEDETITEIRYDYPPKQDYIVRNVLPLLEAAKVQLVYYGHSHLWNRFIGPTGIHFLESSNVGNTYGAHWRDNPRPVPTDTDIPYAALGDPNGLVPQVPSIAPLTDVAGEPLPYIASNDISVFTIFETGTGTVSSYRFDTRLPDSGVIKFDEFQLNPD